MAAQDLMLNAILEVRLSGDLDGQISINTFHYKVTATSLPGAYASITQALSPIAPSIWDDGVSRGLSWCTTPSFDDVVITGQKIASGRYVQVEGVIATTAGRVASATA